MSRITKTLTGITFTDLALGDLGTIAFELEHDFFTRQDLVVATGAGGGGTILVEDTDFTLGGEDTTLSEQVTAQVGSGRNVMSTVTIINPTYQAGTLYFSGKYIADGLDPLDSESTRGLKIGLDIYCTAGDDYRIRPGIIDVAGKMVDMTAEVQLTGESSYSAAWQFITINQAGTIQLRSATGANTARPTDACFQWAESGGTGFSHTKNGYYYGAKERIIGAIWRVSSSSYYFINLGSGSAETGTNALGYYENRVDGTSWQSVISTCNDSDNSSTGTIVTLPCTVTAIKSVMGTQQYNSSTPIVILIPTTYFTVSNFRCRILTPTSGAVSCGVAFHILARWKS